MTPNEYRTKHKRCSTCAFCKKVFPIEAATGYICRVKWQSTQKQKGRFCKVYKAREFKENEN